MLIKALELNFKTNLGVCVCVGMSRLSVCKTTPVQHALPLHGWTKTRRLRAVTVSFDRHCSLCKVYLVWTCLPLHGWTKKRRLRAVTVSLYMGCSLCQIYLLNHGNCGHCLDTSIVCRAHAPEPIQCDIPGHVRGFHTWRLRTTTIDFSLPLHASTKADVVSVQRQRFCSDILEDTLPVWKLPKARPLEIMLFKWLQSAHVRFTLGIAIPIQLL